MIRTFLIYLILIMAQTKIVARQSFSSVIFALISKKTNNSSQIFKYNFHSMIDQLKALEDYLKANRMEKTLQSLKIQILNKYPQGPSSQFLSLIDQSATKKMSKSIDYVNRPLEHKKSSKSRNEELVVEGLLGKIAYSSKLLEDSNINSKIEKLLDNKIFMKAVSSMFPEAQKIYHSEAPSENSYEVRDELDFAEMSNLNSESHQPQNNNIISHIELNQEESSILSQPSLVLEELNRKQSEQDGYVDDNDLGYYEYEFSETELINGCLKLKQKFGYPEKAVKKNSKKEISTKKPQRNGEGSKFPEGIQFPDSVDSHYPLQYNGVIYDILSLKVIFDREKTGYEETTDLHVEKGDILAGRYLVDGVLGSGVFAKVFRVFDKITQEFTCLKMISNNKDFFDQALDEIKLLRYINANCNPDQHHLLKFKGVFYHREHLFIETDLLKDNLYIAYRKNPTFFSIPVLREIARQILEALEVLHSLQVMHADLKPENIMIKSYNPVAIKIVDLGNSCFFHDNLLDYVQSRSYRAPEVVLGVGYDEKIDIWSVGCIMAELWTKNILFYNTRIEGMLARIQGIAGPWPEWMLDKGQNVEKYFSQENLIFFEEGKDFHILIPKPTTLRARIRTEDSKFLNFLEGTLRIDPNFRMSAGDALKHPFIVGN